MQYKRIIVPLMTCAMLLGAAYASGSAAAEFPAIVAHAEKTEDGLTYNTTLADGGVRIVAIPADAVEVVIPEKIGDLEVKRIDPYLFKGNTKLKKVTLPGTLGNQMPGSCFQNCTALETVIIGEGVTRVSMSAFSGCTSLTHVELPSTVEWFWSNCFTDCPSLKELVLPDGLTKISPNWCSGTTTIESLTIGASLEDLSELPLHSSDLKELKVSPDSLYYTAEDNVLYTKGKEILLLYPSHKQNEVTEIVIDDAVKDIDSNAFPYTEEEHISAIHIGASLENFSNLPSFDLLDTYTVSPKNPYFSAENGWLFNKEKTDLYDIPLAARRSITELILPDSVTTLTDSLWGLGDLTAIDIGSVTDLSTFPLSQETLTSISAGKSNPAYTSKDGVLYDKDMTTMVKMPYALAGSTTDLVIPATVTTLEKDALKGLGVLNTLDFGGLVDLPSSSVFNIHHTALSSISCASDNPTYACRDGILYDKDMTTLVKIPFAKASAMTKLTIPDTVTQVGYQALNGLGELTDIHIGGLTDLSKIPYQGDTVKSISAGEGNTQYGSKDGILYTSDLTELLYVPKALVPQITSFVMPETLETISTDSGFMAISGLKSLTIGAAYSEDVTSILIDNAAIETVTVSKNSQSYLMDGSVLYSKDKSEIYWQTEARAAGLTVLEIPDNVRIVKSPFLHWDFPKLTAIRIGTALNEYGARTLANNISHFTHLRSVEVKEDNPNLCSENGLLLSKDKGELYLMPVGSAEKEVVIPPEVAFIHNYEDFPADFRYYAAFGSSGYDLLHYVARVCGWSFTGDINGDSTIGVVDLVAVQKFLLNKTSLTDSQYKLADMNLDGSVDVFDLALYKRLMLRNALYLSPSHNLKDPIEMGYRFIYDQLSITSPEPSYGTFSCKWSIEYSGRINDGEFYMLDKTTTSNTVIINMIEPGYATLILDCAWYPSEKMSEPALTLQYVYYIYGKKSDDPGGDDPDPGTPEVKYGAANVHASVPAGMVNCIYTWSGSGVKFDNPHSASTIARGKAGTTATCFCTITGSMYINGRTTTKTITHTELVIF